MQTEYTIGKTLYRGHSSGFYFMKDTPDKVKNAIAGAHASRDRVRVFYGDQTTGKAWPEEFDVIGTIGRSMGPCRVPLLIASSRSYGGGALLDSCIVAIRSTQSRNWLYRHPSFNPGVWTTGPAETPEYGEAAFHNGSLHAQFKKTGQAARYVQFMIGERFAK